MEVTYILDTEQGIFLRKRSDKAAAEYLTHKERIWCSIEQNNSCPPAYPPCRPTV